MVGWQRHLRWLSLIRHVGKRVEHHQHHAAANFSSSSLSSSFRTISRPLYHYMPYLGISSTRNLLADSSRETYHQSQETRLSESDAEKNEQHNQNTLTKQVQFVVKGINMSSNKVNVVAKMVRGMRVEDAIMQLQVTDKQAAKTVYQALHSARAEATYNHGLDPERLLVAGAFVAKGFLGFHKNRLYFHGKSNNGTKVRPNFQLTVLLREIVPGEEEELAKQRVDNFLYLTKRLRLTKKENKFVPHQLIRNHKGKASNSGPSGMAS